MCAGGKGSGGTGRGQGLWAWKLQVKPVLYVYRLNDRFA